MSGIIPGDIRISLEKEEKDNLTLWPEFHNGVANGLKLSKQILQINPENIKTWIFY
jgi:hypothetical protein